MVLVSLIISRSLAPPLSPPTYLTCISLARLRRTGKDYSLSPLLSSSYSTSRNGRNASVGEESFLKTKWRYIVSVVKSFVQGMKLLIKDAKKARYTNKDGLKFDGVRPHLPSSSTVKLEDLRFIYKVNNVIIT